MFRLLLSCLFCGLLTGGCELLSSLDLEASTVLTVYAE